MGRHRFRADSDDRILEDYARRDYRRMRGPVPRGRACGANIRSASCSGNSSVMRVVEPSAVNLAALANEVAFTSRSVCAIVAKKRNTSAKACAS